MAIPVSIRARPNESSLCDLPAEVRLHIFGYLLDLNNTPSSYGYTGPQSPPKSSLRKHGMVIVSQQLSAEYRQAFYERTKFFLRIDFQNVFEGAPILRKQPRRPELLHEWREELALAEKATISNFWCAPDTMLASLRHCTVYIELGDIVCFAECAHTLALVNQITESHKREINMTRLGYTSRKAYEAPDLTRQDDEIWEARFMSSIQKLLEGMQQLRSVQLVWNTDFKESRPPMNPGTSDRRWTWEKFGAPSVETLKDKRHLKAFQVMVGDQDVDVVGKGERGEGGKWTLKIG